MNAQKYAINWSEALQVKSTRFLTSPSPGSPTGQHNVNISRNIITLIQVDGDTQQTRVSYLDSELKNDNNDMLTRQQKTVTF